MINHFKITCIKSFSVNLINNFRIYDKKKKNMNNEWYRFIISIIYIKYMPLLKINSFSKYLWLQLLNLFKVKNVMATGKLLSTIDISKNHPFGRAMEPI